MLEGRKGLLAGLFVGLCAAYGWGLNRVGFVDPDEPRYAAIGRAMALTGDWVTPRLWGQPWFEKPAFLYWLSGAAVHLGWGPEVSARLPVALLSLAFLCSWYLLLSRIWSSRIAVLARVLLGSSAGWMAYSDLGLTDLPLAVFFNLAVTLFLTLETVPSWLVALAGGICLGFAMLSKGLVPVVLMVPCTTIFWKRWRLACVAAAGCIAAAGPWYAACWYANGDVFFREFVWKHHLERFASSSLQHVQPFWFYVPVLLGALFPWSALLALIRPKRSDHREMVLGLTAAFGFAFFSAAANKLPGYLLPLLPSICLLIALSLPERLPIWAAAATTALLGLLPLALQIVPGAVETGITHVKPQWALLLAVVPAGAIGLILRRNAPALLCVGGLTMCAGIVYLKAILGPEMDAKLSARSDWAIASRYVSPCVSGGARSWRYSLYFYAGRELPDCPGSVEAGQKKGRIEDRSPSTDPHPANTN